MSGNGAGRRPIEWPTVALIVLVYGGIAALVAGHALLPWWLLVVAGGALLTLYGSLVHEVLHGHPTGNRRLDDALVWTCLWLWYPNRLYRDVHLAHHRDEHLTDPVLDPESHYLLPATWQRLPRLVRALLVLDSTLLGRLVLGPPIAITMLVVEHLPRLLRGEPAAWRLWGGHALACAPVVAWLLWWEMPVWLYLAACVWPAVALTQLRTFAEHRAAVAVGERSAVVEAAWPLALLFLNNNLHAVHHAMPGLAWYRLPALWRARREAFVGGNGGYVFPGYAALVRRYLLTPRDAVAHPFMTAPASVDGPAVAQTA